MIYLDVTKGLNHIGRLGENEHRTLRFRESAESLTLYPEAVVTVLHKRPGDLTAYPVPAEYVDVSSGMVCWTIQSGDLARVGRGKVELVFSEGDVIAKSVIYDTFVDPALNGSEEPPDPWRTWIDRIEKGTDERITALEESTDERIAAVEESMDGKAEATDTVLQTILSRGRKADDEFDIGEASFAFGLDVMAKGKYSHAEGRETIAWGEATHAEGYKTSAYELGSHAEGSDTIASNSQAHAEGSGTRASGPWSHAEGIGTIASNAAMHVSGSYNTQPTENEIFVIGNGQANTIRSNAVTVYKDGSAKIKGNFTIGSTTITEAQLQALLAMLS